jgi:hypothetical protein
MITLNPKHLVTIKKAAIITATNIHDANKDKYITIKNPSTCASSQNPIPYITKKNPKENRSVKKPPPHFLCLV